MWWQSFPEPKTMLAYAAKSNDLIMRDFLQHYRMMDSSERVIIFWSHSERHITSIGNGDRPDWTKNLSPSDYPQNAHKTFNKYFENTLEYMLMVQELCKAKNIEYYFMCNDHYIKLERYRKTLKNDWTLLLDFKRIFNWPAPTVKLLDVSQEIFNSHDYFLAEWVATSLVQQFGKALTEATGEDHIHRDRKHLNIAGLEAFRIMFEAWFEDSNKDLTYYINTLDNKSSKYFTEMEPHLINVTTDIHWIEYNIAEFADKVLSGDTKKNVDFIYEQ
tara:strand:- start:2351 stop:3172 length:822 start_codon:yes stop_codon:yes gene_type:complete